MKLVSLNVALFEKNNQKIQTFLEEQNPDIICLQEVTRRVDQQAGLEYSSKEAIDLATPELTSQFYSPTASMSKFATPNFHAREDFTVSFGGFLDFGLYSKSKFPITFAKNIFVQNQQTLITDFSQWPDQDYKSIQVTDIDVDGKRIRTINYHGFWSKNKQDSDKTLMASKKILELAQEVSYPKIICGDFNLFPTTESIRMLDKEYRNLVNEFKILTTRPQTNELSNLDRNIVDYIFVSKDIQVSNFKVIDSDVSDHLPLVLEFEL